MAAMHPLAEAMHENYLAALQRVTVLGPGGESTRLGPWRLLDAGLDFDYFNIAAVTAAAPDADLAIEAAIAWFRAREKPFRFIFRNDADERLIEAAALVGFEMGETEPAMLALPFDNSGGERGLVRALQRAGCFAAGTQA